MSNGKVHFEADLETAKEMADAINYKIAQVRGLRDYADKQKRHDSFKINEAKLKILESAFAVFNAPVAEARLAKLHAKHEERRAKREAIEAKRASKKSAAEKIKETVRKQAARAKTAQ